MSSENSSDPAKLNGVQRLLEAGLLVSSIIAMFIMLALFTFDQADPGWAQAGYQTPVKNLGGAVGAYLSDLLLNLFGVVAYSLPFAIAITGWLLFQRFYRLMQIDYLTLGLKIIGFVMVYIGVTSIASMNFGNIFIFSAGGIVGDFLSTSLIPYLSFVGTTLIFLMFFLVGFVLLTGLSWLAMIDALGKYTIDMALLLAKLPAFIKEKFGTRLEARADNQLKSSKKAARLADKHTDAFESIADNRVEASKHSSIEIPDESIDEQPQYPHNDIIVDNTDIDDEDFVGQNLSPSGFNSQDYAADSDNHDDYPEADEIQVKDAFENMHSDHEMSFSALDDSNNDINVNDPFVAIDDLIDGSVKMNVQDHVSNEEIMAAFEHVEPIKVNKNEATNEQVVEDKPSEQQSTLPSLDLLDKPDKTENPISQEDLDQVSRLVEAKLLEYGVKAEVVGVYPGPVITRFELDLAPGIKASKITGLSTDLARSLSAKAVRVVEVIEGKSVIGIELPNKYRETVFFSSVLANDKFAKSKSPLTMAIGSDISGQPVITDLAKMPHLLVAGTTGSGKSVAINTMIVSILYKSSPADVRMIMIDPKQVELSVYDGIPHLLSEVVTDMKEAANALRWCVGEMERRYQLMSKLGVRNLKGYNEKVKKAIEAGEPLIDPLWQPTDAFTQTPPTLDKLPAIIIIVDEFADMMMIVGKKVEELIARIAQKARAAGIHLILATQRPSADVITGLIKANIPTRIALRVQSRIESRIILDQQGAEQLLGMGDMFYLAPGEALPIRVHGAFVNDDEVHAVVNDWKSRAEPDYIEDILTGGADQDILLPGEQAEEDANNEVDPLYDEALAFITESRRVSISSIQRKFRIGYNRSARIVEDMEAHGVVSRPGTNGAREVLAPPPVKG
ncbi:MAG: DNA translocase FtsK [Thalassotalea sp.]